MNRVGSADTIAMTNPQPVERSCKPLGARGHLREGSTAGAVAQERHHLAIREDFSAVVEKERDG